MPVFPTAYDGFLDPGRDPDDLQAVTTRQRSRQRLAVNSNLSEDERADRGHGPHGSSQIPRFGEVTASPYLIVENAPALERSRALSVRRLLPARLPRALTPPA